MSHPPTAEQAAIVDAFGTGDDLVIEAGAGAGKTSTLRMLAAAAPRRRGLYVAFNRSTRDDAARSFPAAVTCKTTYGVAFGPMRVYDRRHRLDAPRLPARQVADLLGVREPLRLADDLAPLAPQRLAVLAVQTVARWCRSADDEIGRRHVPTTAGLEAVHADLTAAVVPYARRAWADLTSRDGCLKLEHQHYLKAYQLTRPHIRVDWLAVDEAQDLNPAMQAIVSYQTHAQVVTVGDSCQAINGWNGAVNAMTTAQGKRLCLSQSFRFGPAIATEANKWLALLDSRLRLTGAGWMSSTVEPLTAPDAILTRSNATALARVMAAVDDGRAAALVGGGDDLRRLALAAVDLQAGLGTDHPELLAFGSWHDVCSYVDQDGGADDLRVLVDLVNRYGADALVRTVDQLVGEDRADVVVSTAHKAKGREWPRVRIADDFREPKDDRNTGSQTFACRSPGELDPAEGMLAYVAVTRAQHHLDRSGLDWVDRWLPSGWQYDRDPARRLADVAAAAPTVDPNAAPVPEQSTEVPTPPDTVWAPITAALPTPAPRQSAGLPAQIRELHRMENVIEASALGTAAEQAYRDSLPHRETAPGAPLCPACQTHGRLLDDGLCRSCSATPPPSSWPPPTPIDAALVSVSPPYAAADGAVWIADPPAHHAGDPPPAQLEDPLLVVPHCYRCGGDECYCDPAVAADYSSRNDVPAGARTAREQWARAQLTGAR